MPETTPAPADRVAAYLTEVQERFEDLGYTEEPGGVMTLGLDAGRLLAAVEAVQAAISRWEPVAAGNEALGEFMADLRRVITRKLLTEDQWVTHLASLDAPVIDIGYLSLPAEVQAAIEAGPQEGGE